MCGMRWRKAKRRSAWPTRDAATGNLAFDAYVEETLARIAQQRQALAEEEAAFGAFLEAQKLIRDRSEFELFLASRREAAAVEMQT